MCWKWAYELIAAGECLLFELRRSWFLTFVCGQERSAANCVVFAGSPLVCRREQKGCSNTSVIWKIWYGRVGRKKRRVDSITARTCCHFRHNINSWFPPARNIHFFRMMENWIFRRFPASSRYFFTPWEETSVLFSTSSCEQAETESSSILVKALHVLA